MTGTSGAGSEARATTMRRWAWHWLRACREIPDRALAVLDRHEGGAEEQIHEFRRLMKAWRALLKLAPAGLAQEARAVRAGAGQLRRGFGTARDSSVIAKILGKLCPDLAPKRDAEAAAAADLLRDQGAAVRGELRRLSAAMTGWSLPDETGDFLARAFKRSYRRARRQARSDPRRMGIQRLHDWRTMIVDLSCQLSFFAPADPARLRRQAGMAERLRSRVGEVIDLDLVRSYLAETALPDTGKGVLREIEHRSARQRRKSAKLADRLFDRRSKRAGADLREAMGRRAPRRISLA